MRYRPHIEVGRGVTVLKGAVVEADPVGSIRLADHVTICRYAVLLSGGGTIDLARGVLIGDFCNLYGTGGLTIEEGVMLASGVRIMTAEHSFDDPTKPVGVQPEVPQPVRIGRGAWLAANVVVLAGVTIGENAVIGAGAVVTRDVAASTVAVGVPARAVRSA
jgi:acetyltransferase-like isoleucine patch superfamily enzyme